jgi:hypothetical protein
MLTIASRAPVAQARATSTETRRRSLGKSPNDDRASDAFARRARVE